MTTYLEEIAASIRRTAGGSGSDVLYAMYALLCLAKGTEVTDEDVHNAWVAAAGIASSTDRDVDRLPFDQIPLEAQRRDRPFVNAIHDVAQSYCVGGRTRDETAREKTRDHIGRSIDILPDRAE